jgi:amino acid transporter
LLGIRVTTSVNLLLALLMMAVFTGINAIGLRALKYLIYVGITCEIVATLVVGLALVIGFRRQPLSILTHVATSPGSVYTASAAGALLAALAYGGWIILGFDSCGAIAEETIHPRRGVPRAVMMSVITVGIVDIIASLGVLLAQPNLRAAITGAEADPIGAAVREGLGGWAAKPFLGVVVLGFISCGLAVQAATVRVVYSFSRDSMIPFHRAWARVNQRTQTPLNAVFLTGVLGAVIFVYAKTLSVLVGFATGGYFLAFFCPVFAALLVRLRRRWRYEPGQFSLGPFAMPVLIVAVLWSGLEFVNIAWPRQPNLPWYQNWAVELAAIIIGGLGALYYVARQPYRNIPRIEEPKQAAELRPP